MKNISSSPSSLGDDHFSSHLVEFAPEVLVMKDNFDVLHPLHNNQFVICFTIFTFYSEGEVG